MKKEIQSEKINKNMDVVDKFNKLVISILSNVLDDDVISSVKSELVKNKDVFEAIFVTKKSKKTKDLNAPKRAKTSYIIFCVNKRQEISESNPNLSAKEIIQELGNMWRSLSDEEKIEYVTLSNKDKHRYEEEMKLYVPTNKEQKTQKDKNLSGPKKGLSAYIFFCKKIRDSVKKENPHLNTKEITSALGKKWMSLSEKEKEPYIKLAYEDKNRFEDEKKNLGGEILNKEEKKLEEEKKPNKKEKKPKKEEKKPKKKPNKEEKKPNKEENKPKKSKKESGFTLFCDEERDSFKENNPDLNSQQLVKQLTNAWNLLEDEERSDYNDRANSE
jgi:hypothetical protein